MFTKITKVQELMKFLLKKKKVSGWKGEGGGFPTVLTAHTAQGYHIKPHSIKTFLKSEINRYRCSHHHHGFGC
jgi:hypothetical protein